MEQQCGNCEYFRRGGECCKFPPFANIWPKVEASDWCSFWEPKHLEPPALEREAD